MKNRPSKLSESKQSPGAVVDNARLQLSNLFRFSVEDNILFEYFLNDKNVPPHGRLAGELSTAMSSLGNGPPPLANMACNVNEDKWCISMCSAIAPGFNQILTEKRPSSFRVSIFSHLLAIQAPDIEDVRLEQAALTCFQKKYGENFSESLHKASQGAIEKIKAVQLADDPISELLSHLFISREEFLQHLAKI